MRLAKNVSQFSEYGSCDQCTGSPTASILKVLASPEAGNAPPPPHYQRSTQMVRSVVGKVVWMTRAAETKEKARGPSSRRRSLLVAVFLGVVTLMATATAAL